MTTELQQHRQHGRWPKICRIISGGSSVNVSRAASAGKQNMWKQMFSKLKQHDRTLRAKYFCGGKQKPREKSNDLRMRVCVLACQFKHISLPATPRKHKTATTMSISRNNNQIWYPKYEPKLKSLGSWRTILLNALITTQPLALVHTTSWSFASSPAQQQQQQQHQQCCYITTIRWHLNTNPSVGHGLL